MIKNSEGLRNKIKENLNQKADAFIDRIIETSDTNDFTIDSIEDLMIRFNSETNEIVLNTVNEAIASFDEKKIISKKNKKSKDCVTTKKELKK